jgi:transglutaminase-like putative cysteine protease
MSARYRITHTSRYVYPTPVAASYNEARLTPITTDWQLTMESVVRIEPLTWQHEYTDYWGTRVRAFEVMSPHCELAIEASSLVEVDASHRPVPHRDLGWKQLRSGAVADAHCEYLTQSASTQPARDLAAVADAIAAAHGPHETALQICTYVHQAMTYMPGSTGVHTTARQAWAERRGVCQDFAQVVVGALRQVGIPARYVSGYLHPDAVPEIGVDAVGESHAWVEWWAGEWFGHDPTNDSDVIERHVVVGRGRDYADVAPIKGIVSGAASSDLQVAVTITRTG